jgi:hypothetical protein
MSRLAPFEGDWGDAFRDVRVRGSSVQIAGAVYAAAEDLRVSDVRVERVPPKNKPKAPDLSHLSIKQRSMYQASVVAAKRKGEPIPDPPADPNKRAAETQLAPDELTALTFTVSGLETGPPPQTFTLSAETERAHACPSGHPLSFTYSDSSVYAEGWDCDGACKKGFDRSVERFFCGTCNTDICSDCMSADDGSPSLFRNRALRRVLVGTCRSANGTVSHERLAEKDLGSAKAAFHQGGGDGAGASAGGGAVAQPVARFTDTDGDRIEYRLFKNRDARTCHLSCYVNGEEQVAKVRFLNWDSQLSELEDRGGTMVLQPADAARVPSELRTLCELTGTEPEGKGKGKGKGAAAGPDLARCVFTDLPTAAAALSPSKQGRKRPADQLEEEEEEEKKRERERERRRAAGRRTQAHSKPVRRAGAKMLLASSGRHNFAPLALPEALLASACEADRALLARPRAMAAMLEWEKARRLSSSVQALLDGYPAQGEAVYRALQAHVAKGGGFLDSAGLGVAALRAAAAGTLGFGGAGGDEDGDGGRGGDEARRVASIAIHSNAPHGRNRSRQLKALGAVRIDDIPLALVMPELDLGPEPESEPEAVLPMAQQLQRVAAAAA